MARIRTIKPEFCTSEQIAECSTTVRLLFATMWCFCDDAGRHVANCKRLKMECFPGDGFSDKDIAGFVTDLITAGLLVEYEFEGRLYWEVTGWSHQKIDKPSYKYPPKHDAKRSIPLIESNAIITRDSESIRRTVDDYSESGREWSPAEGSLVEGKGMEGNGRESSLVNSTSVRGTEVVDAWNRRCEEAKDPRMGKVRTLTGKRQAKLRSRLSEPGFANCWEDAISLLPNPVRPGFDWTPSFDWLIENDSNAVRIAEGAYASTATDSALAKARQSIEEDF